MGAGPIVGADDAFIRKFSADGDVLWTRQYGTALDDEAFAVAVDDSGSVYMGGMTRSPAGTFAGNPFLQKYDSAGNLLWTQELDTPTGDPLQSIALNGKGSVFISGWDMVGANNYRGYLTKLTEAGEFRWTHYFSESSGWRSPAVVANAAGELFVGGHRLSNVAFVTKYAIVPEPNASLLSAALGCGLVLARSRRLHSC